MSRMHVQHRLVVIVTSIDKYLQHPKKFNLRGIRNINVKRIIYYNINIH
jgi:hypothetical protein